MDRRSSALLQMSFLVRPHSHLHSCNPFAQAVSASPYNSLSSDSTPFLPSPSSDSISFLLSSKWLVSHLRQSTHYKHEAFFSF